MATKAPGLNIPLQSAFLHLGYEKTDFPVSEDCSTRIFSVPMHPYLKAEDQERIASIIDKVIN